jgi:hypothetical protein
MTSVQSHQQPSSGSKSVLLAVLITISGISCGAFGSSTIEVEEFDTTEITDDKEVVVVKDKDDNNGNSKKGLVKVVFHGEEYQVKKVENDFTIALFLPFMSKSHKHPLTNAMLDFLEGVQIAVSELEEQGMNVKLKVYDTYNKASEVKRLLRQEDLKDVDLVLGPVYEKPMKEVENYCAMYHIPLVAPLKYYSKTSSTDFPLFNTFPSDSMFYHEMGRQVALNYPNHMVHMLLTKDGFIARKHFRKGYESISFSSVGVVEVAKANEVCLTDSTFIFAPTKNEAESRVCINALKNEESVCLMGLKDWLNFSVLDYPVLNQLNFHYATSYHVDKSDSSIYDVRVKYRDQFEGEPGKYFYIAYDQMRFFGEALMAFGSDFPKYINNRGFEYHYNEFRFVKKMGYYENESTNVIRFSNFELNKIEK